MLQEEYVVISNKVYRLFPTMTSANKGVLYFTHSGVLCVYEELRDGPTITAEEAAKLYPEWFV